MIYQITNLLLQAFVTIIGGACLIRCYLQFFQINIGKATGYQIGAYLMTLSNWLIIPLRKVLPSIGRLDSASLLAAYLIGLAKVFVLWLLSGAPIEVVTLLIFGVFELIELFLSGVIGAVFVSIILSWVSANSMFYYFLSSLTDPLLSPIRRNMPRLGMFDLSPLILLIAIQVLQIILANLKLLIMPHLG